MREDTDWMMVHDRTDGSITADHHWSDQTLQRLPCTWKCGSLRFCLYAAPATDVFFGCPTAVLLDWIIEWFPLTRSLVRFPVSLSEVCQRFSQS